MEVELIEIASFSNNAVRSTTLARNCSTSSPKTSRSATCGVAAGFRRKKASIYVVRVARSRFSIAAAAGCAKSWPRATSTA